jgi:hypothetical protein
MRESTAAESSDFVTRIGAILSVLLMVVGVGGDVGVVIGEEIELVLVLELEVVLMLALVLVLMLVLALVLVLVLCEVIAVSTFVLTGWHTSKHE